MKKLVFADNPVDNSTWEMVEVDDILAEIVERFPEWPSAARLYHTTVSEATDITPRSQQDIDYVQALEAGEECPPEAKGEVEVFVMVIYPENPLVLLVIGLVAVAVALVLFLNVNTGSTEAARTSSPNNSLSRRVNSARPNSRIPDIYGTVRSTPDLLGEPYRFYENNLEIELSYMCIGRGEFDVSDIRDGGTPVRNIGGTNVEIYAPNTSPNSGDAPQLTEGSPIGLPVKSVFPVDGVNGQELRPRNSGIIAGLDATATYDSGTNIGTFTFAFNPGASAEWDGWFEDGNPPTINLTDKYRVGDFITVDNFTSPLDQVPGTAFFDALFVIESLTEGLFSFTVPSGSANQALWNSIPGGGEPSSTTVNLNTSAAGVFQEGPFDITNVTGDIEIVANFVARNGLYSRNDQNQQSAEVVDLRLYWAPLDANGNQTGPQQPLPGVIQLVGSGTSTSTAAITRRATELSASNPITAPCRIWANRETETNKAATQVVDTVQWQHLYALQEVAEDDFGDVTTALVESAATPGALAVKQRRFNMEVTRKIPTRISGTSFTAPQATTNASDIITAITLDQSIGRRTLDNLDLDQIYDTVDEIETYFDNPAMRQFSYTFDDINFTYEQSIAAIAQAVFSIAYRQGPKLRLSFEKENPDAALLFNHRNKTPGSEKRTYTFGGVNRRDGVELKYIDPDTDTEETIFRPANQSAINPQKITTIGVRTNEQAQILADRAFNKIQYQVVASEFEATGEGMLLVQNDRILVADNTRPETQDGEIISQTGLLLKTSQPVDFSGGGNLALHVQLSDRTVEVFDITEVPGDPFAVTIDRAPLLPLVLGNDRYARTIYTITDKDNGDAEAFILQKVRPINSSQTARISAINYDSRYYANDQDVALGP